jgi:hypothetical protein
MKKSSTRKSLTTAAVVAGLSVAGLVLVASPANAASNPTTIEQGATGTLWTDVNVPNTAWDHGRVRINAPAGTTFVTGQTSIQGYYNTGRADYVTATGCTYTGGNTQITCDFPGATSGNANSTLTWASQITAAKNATPGTISADAHVWMPYNVTGGFSGESVVKIKPSAPVVSKIDNSTGTTKLSGTAAPGATVTVKDAAGNLLGTAVADDQGDYVIDLGKDLAGSSSDLSVTQTAGGIASDATPVKAADLPIVNPAIAGGAAIAALAAVGATVMVRRRRAGQI